LGRLRRNAAPGVTDVTLERDGGHMKGGMEMVINAVSLRQGVDRPC